MDRQKYLDIVASRLREMGVSDEEMVRPLRTFEQFLIDNDDDELYRSLEDQDELDDLIQNIYMMILKRRKRRAEKQQSTSNNTNIQANVQPEPLQPEPLVPDTGTQYEQFSQPSAPMQNKPVYGSQQVNDAGQSDMNETVTMNRVTQEPVIDEDDNSSTRTINAVKPEDGIHEQNTSEYTSQRDAQNTIRNQNLDLRRQPVRTYEKPAKLSRAEAKHEAMHMYEDLPKISDPSGTEYNDFDPNAFDSEVHVKGSLAFWLIFIFTLPITVPILAAIAIAFIAVFAAMAVLIVGFIALLVVDVIVGTALSLVGIIYGITQTFTVVPIGLYEIGIGIIIGGAALFLGILFYNAAIRLLPFLCRKWYEFFGFCCHQLKKLFNYLKKESVKA